MDSPFFFAAVPGPDHEPDRWHIYIINPTKSTVSMCLARVSTLPESARSPLLESGEKNTHRQQFTLQGLSWRMVDDLLVPGDLDSSALYVFEAGTTVGDRLLANAAFPEYFPALKEWHWCPWIPVFKRPGCVIRTAIDRYTSNVYIGQNPLSDRMAAAFNLAYVIHGNMKRKCGNEPYLTHPFGVHALLTTWGTEEDIRIAGLLHDTIEDVPEEKKSLIRSSIERMFGARVLSFVEHVTEQEKNLPWKVRKERAIKTLQTAPPQALVVACADKTHNAFSLLESLKEEGEDVWKHFNAPKDEVLWYYRSMAELFNARLPDRYVRQLTEYVEVLEEKTG